MKMLHKSATFYSRGTQNQSFHPLQKITEQGKLHALYCQSHEWAPQRSFQRPSFWKSRQVYLAES